MIVIGNWGGERPKGEIGMHRELQENVSFGCFGKSQGDQEGSYRLKFPYCLFFVSL
jgi:hypothetical protein